MSLNFNLDDIKFDIVRKGYSTEQVDRFIDTVAGQADAADKTIEQLQKQVDELTLAVENYKSREFAIEQSLLEASSLRKEIIEKANSDAKKLIDEAKETVEMYKNKLELIKQEEEQTIKRIKFILDSQSANLEYVIKEG